MKETFLVVNTSYFGDTLLTSNLIQNIRHNHPQGEIIFLANAPFATVAEHLKGVDQVLAYDKKGKDKGLKGIYHFYQQYKQFFAARNLVAAFVIYGNERGIILAKLWGAKKIYSHNTGLINCLVDNPKHIAYPNLPQVAQRHGYLYNFHNPNQLANYPMAWEFKPGEQEAGAKILEQYLPKNHGKIVALCTLSKKTTKDLPLDIAQELIANLTQQGYTVIHLGAGPAAAKYDKALRMVTPDYISLVNKTSLAELAAILALSNSLISVDTGTMHLGLAVGVPTICLFFIKDPDHLAAWGPDPNMYTTTVLVSPIQVQDILLAQEKLMAQVANKPL